jgi:hypothetical protein
VSNTRPIRPQIDALIRALARKIADGIKAQRRAEAEKLQQRQKAA